MSIAEERVGIETPDGETLAGRLFLPDGSPATAVVLHGATGVPRDFYANFARWLAEERGAACLIYAYRGTEATTSEALRRSPVTMIDWGVSDQGAALGWLADRFPEAEIRVVGHSLGGFMTMFHPQAARVSRLTAVASGPAWWRRSPMPARLGIWAFWHVTGPLGIALLGYLPGRRLGVGADMPSGVFRVWKRWCTNPGLHRPDWGGALPEPVSPGFSGRLTLVGASDDTIMPPEVVADLADFYSEAKSELRVLRPEEVAGKPIGHLAVFRRANAAAWPMLYD